MGRFSPPEATVTRKARTSYYPDPTGSGAKSRLDRNGPAPCYAFPPRLATPDSAGASSAPLPLQQQPALHWTVVLA